MTPPPTGTVTFLFTDIEGSTRLLEELGEGAYAEALAEHQHIVRRALANHRGFEVDTQGDAFFCAFASARDAVAAVQEIQQGLIGPIRVRAGLHSGEALLYDDRYIGSDVHRAARIAATGHGSQTVLTAATAGLLDPGAAEFRDLGEHRLKDLTAPVRLYQLGSHEFPPLRSLHRTNLPQAAWPLLGRDRELEEIRALVADNVRLVTLTGTGGSGKTRLALQAAAELTDEFPGGAFFVALAPLRDVSAVHGAVAEAVGLQPDDDVAAWLGSRRALLVMDNLEHLSGVDVVLAQLLGGETVVIATSRASLHLSAERELPVEPLPDQAAVELFVSRATAAGRRVEADESVAEVCRRLDNLPLALELAAARAKLLSPAVLLQRLDAALPLLTGGARDRPERQRTLRATIEWSHDLLDPNVQAAFRRLSVFRGPFTLDAAEAIAGADLDRLAALLDQSLLKPLGDDRFFLLETLREFARERLDEAGETDGYALRHARWYLERLEHDEQAMWGPRRAELLAWFATEEDNLRAMLDRLTTDAIVDAARATHLLYRYWLSRGAWAEARQRLHGLIDREDLPNEPRASLLICLAELEVNVGDMEAAERASYEAIKLVKPGGEAHAYALRSLGIAAAQRGRPDDAVQFGQQILEVAESLTERMRIEMRGEAAAIFGEVGHIEEARALTQEVMDDCRRAGYAWHEAVCVANLAQFDLDEGSYEAARAGFASALVTVRGLDAFSSEIEFLPYLGLALLGLDQRREARASYLNLLDLSTRDGVVTGSRLFDALTGIALAAEPESASKAGRLHGAAASLRRTANLSPSPKRAELERRFEQRLIDALGEQAWEEKQALGANLTQEQAIELARSLACAI